MTEYLSKLQDAWSMWWQLLGPMERYWTLIGAYLVVYLLIRVIRWTSRDDQVIRYVQVREDPPAS